MFRCYRQLESSDCGLTCIRMVARHFGLKVPMKYLHSITDMSRLGMSVMDILNCFSRLDIESRPVRLGIDYLDRMPLPAILFWQQRHFVVLYKISGKNCYIADPAQGKVRYSKSELQKYWIGDSAERGLVILADPGETFSTERSEKDRTLLDFFKYIETFIGKCKRSFIYTLLITVAVLLSDLAIPLLLSRTIDEGIGTKDISLIVMLLLGQLAISLGNWVSTSGMDLLLTKLGLRINLNMVSDFMERLARYPLSFFDRKVSSDLILKITDQTRIKDFILDFPNTLFIIVLTFSVFSCLLFHYSPLIFAIFIAVSTIEILWNLLFLNQKKTIDYALFTATSENQNHTYELTHGMADLKVNTAEKSKIKKWKETQTRLNDISLKNFWLGAKQNGGHLLISRTKELSILGIGAAMVISGDMTFGVMMTLSYITGRLAQPFSQISSEINSLQSAVLSYQRINEVIEDDKDIRGNLPYKNSNMEFRNVWFRYPGASSPFVIRNFNMKISPGQVIALVGESGCGKSTLIKLMLGFYLPQKGELRLSDVPVNKLDCTDWISHCGVVMQEARIFSSSILENIAMSDEHPDATRAMEILKSVGLDNFISSLPMGIHTLLGVSGIEMSGGQKQRLMIARALYKNPDILFLDEATSSLDANNEKLIVENIRNLRRDKTIVIAAHRLSTVCNADHIIFIKEGEIIESGTHDCLIELNGEYRRLVQNQLQLSV